MYYTRQRITRKIERAINGFLSLHLMGNPFEQTPAEKEECVLDMLERRYGWNQIMKECHVSPNTISSVKKKFFGDDASKSVSQISKETQALKLFKEGWKPLDTIEAKINEVKKSFYPPFIIFSCNLRPYRKLEHVLWIGKVIFNFFVCYTLQLDYVYRHGAK